MLFNSSAVSKQSFRIERRIGGPSLRSPTPMSLQSWLWTSFFTFSIEPAIFPYVSPFPINGHSSRAFGDVVLRVVVSVSYIVLVFFGRRCFDCWDAYRDLDSLGYTYRTGNHYLHFIDPDTGDHTDTMESRGIASRSSWGRTTGRRITVTIWLTTCSWRGASHREYHLSYSSCISSRAPIRHVYNYLPPPPPPRDALAMVSPIHPHLRKQVLCHIILIIFGLESYAIFF